MAGGTGWGWGRKIRGRGKEGGQRESMGSRRVEKIRMGKKGQKREEGEGREKARGEGEEKGKRRRRKRIMWNKSYHQY